MTRAAFPESAAAILRPAIHATAAAARQRAISAALYLSAIQGAQRTALRAPRNIPRAKHRTSRNPETNVMDSGIQPRHEQSHPLREKSQTSASRTASAHLSAAVLALSAAVFLLATPAHAQSTNQLYIDSNISLAIHAEGNRRRRHRQHRARRATRSRPRRHDDRQSAPRRQNIGLCPDQPISRRRLMDDDTCPPAFPPRTAMCSPAPRRASPHGSPTVAAARRFRRSPRRRRPAASTTPASRRPGSGTASPTERRSQLAQAR